ncbi:MAG: 2,3-bisphosphoglycerate-independent phosphoglycerate mutase [Candidatus Staskawiczbacteria bacterium]|nr:2,3-bisphosphoglycerate-independent phosphoglycerate mutase [Candidatus Staskawiczbacteria bacterium]
MESKRRKIILIIRDGWGYRKSAKQNALTKVYAPINYELMKKYPNTLLKASGEAVGLPKGYQGNSEVGHMAIGSGRVIFQSLAKISKSIKDGSFYNIKEFLDAIENCKKNKTSLHLIGLLQTEGVHSHIEHLFALLDLCKKQNFKDVFVHAITDGRDSLVNDGVKKVKLLEDRLKKIGFGKIVTISGRYYAMDRDKRWDRTKKAYDCIVNSDGAEFTNAVSQIKNCYLQNQTDEFIVPCKLAGYSGVKESDSIIFFNFRTDRTRQLTEAIVENSFTGWDRKPLNVFFVCMTQYYTPINARVAFKDDKIENILGEVISKDGLNQLRISETEKYAHVTFFFNCQTERPFIGEDRILIPSPKVATYDLKPEMSAYELTDKIVEAVKTNKYDLIVTNLVNCDMVGHTGIMKAIYSAVKTVDNCVGKIVEEGLLNKYTILVTADHGNAEDKTAKNNTNHTKNPVPFIIVSDELELKRVKLRKNAGLSDIAPTILALYGLEKPLKMTGENLIKNYTHLQ